jgi:glycosyltransferase involved in cell wall biosynthesis
MKILEVATDAPPFKGGISRLVGILSSGLRQQGHMVHVLTPRIRFREFKLSAAPFRRYNGYDIIHVHGPTPFLSDMALMTNHKRSVVYTHHAEISWLAESLSKTYRNFHRFLAKRARFIIVHSYDYARLFKEANIVLIRIPCPFEPPKNFKVENKLNQFTVLYVGQFRPFKGIDMLIKAARILREVKFVLVGDGYLKSKFVCMAKDLRNVEFGTAPDDESLKRFYRQAHVICLPSVNMTEAWGLVLVEGALYGCVPLASNLIGVRENVSLLRGLSFEVGSLVSLVEKIRMCSEDRRLWKGLAVEVQNAACRYARKYTPEHYVKMHEELFRKCL